MKVINKIKKIVMNICKIDIDINTNFLSVTYG